MRYFPHTPEDITEMLKTVGVGSLEDLFGTIPDATSTNCAAVWLFPLIIRYSWEPAAMNTISRYPVITC
jgi:glycine cleavage system pyridoxal-binding protein P